MQPPASFLFIMDPYDTLNMATETSLLLMQGLIDRGQKAFWLQQEGLTLVDGQPIGQVYPVERAEPLQLGAPRRTDLNRFDAVLVRKDPPFDRNYLHITLMLDFLDPRVLQVNEVRALRNFNEKLLPLRWPELTPPTIVSMSVERLERFAIEHREIVLKPLDDCSGRGVQLVVWDKGGRFRFDIRKALLDTNGKPRFVVAQKYLRAVRNGDKRVYLVNGKAVGMVNRLPRPGSFLANIHQGAKCVSADLTDREMQIIETIKPLLIDHGIFLAGADFIDGYLTELNITSPSAVRQINEVSGGEVQHSIVDAMIRKINELRPIELGKASRRVGE